ncbi:MAG: type II and III secretion system protein family protein, partial [Hyphomonadaceae bacterium]|nr:type II and III secretion system protein family protein [Hyphomonadaceae bacterium]
DNETEIVVIVTPYVVRPTDPKSIRTPLDGYENASDAAGFFRQRLNAVYRAPGAEQDGQKFEGPQGHILP